MHNSIVAGFFSAGLLLAWQPASGGSNSSAVPFELDHGHIFVIAWVNGKGPYRFGFDTGASGMGRVDSSLTAELSLPPAGQATTSDGVRTATADLVAVESLRVGNLEKRGLSLLSRDYNRGRKAGLQPIQGIVARDFFADRLVTIDYPAHLIRFAEGSLDPKAAGVVAYGPSFTISVCFDSGCYPAKVDTGSSRAIVIPKDLATKVIAGPAVPIGRGIRTNSSGTLYEMKLNEPVKVGGVTAAVDKLIYADPSEDVINVGSDFLKDYVLTIDQRHQLLRISRP
jgi:hypothetical protein